MKTNLPTEIRTITNDDGSVHHFGVCRAVFHKGVKEITPVTRSGKMRIFKCITCHFEAKAKGQA